MDLTLDPAQQKVFITLLSFIAVVCAIVVVSWPYMVRDTLSVRMKRLAEENERLRIRERERLGQTGEPASLRRKPRKLLKNVAQRLNLLEGTSDSGTAGKLRMAGYRGESAMITYVVVRVIAPFVLMALAVLYIFFVLKLDHPLTARLAMVAVAGLLGYFSPAIYVQNQITKRQLAMQRAWPDALDLMLICVESGMSIEAAFRKVSEEITEESVELAEELGLTTAELSYLQNRQQALDNLGRRTGLEGVKAVVTSLRQAERHGTSIGRSLRVLAQESRDERISLAEKKAAALPPKLTVPMILFFLPVLFAVIITPAAIQIMETH